MNGQRLRLLLKDLCMDLRRMKMNFENIHPSAISAGDIFYECEMGLNMKVEAITTPKEVAEGEWEWRGENVYTGVPIQYRWSEKLSHYSPRLYALPQYFTIKDGVPVFEIVGGGEERYES
jgi:hypothetical protein